MRSLLIAAGVASAIGCGAQSSASSPAGGLYGSVRISPSTPVCLAGKSCAKPAHGFKLAFSSSGRTVTVTTDAKGRYRVRLEPGRYAVRAAGKSRNPSPKAGLQPHAVSVPGDRYAKRNFVYDSGIR